MPAARSFEDLIAWQLAHQVELNVFEFTAKPPTCHDWKFCNQIRESARSAPRNTSEGFGRYYPKEFCRFLRYAHGSLHETLNQLQEARQLDYLNGDEFLALKRLTLRAIKANNNLKRYLSTATAPAWRDQPSETRDREPSTGTNLPEKPRSPESPPPEKP